jgi:hypothetical protein
LVEEWDETCDLSLFDQGKIFYIEVIRGNRALTISAAVGQRLSAHATASGKLFLAYLPVNELEAILSKPLDAHTEKTITSPDKLRVQLEKIRNQGYACVQLLAAAIEKAGSLEPAAVRDAMAASDMDTVIGHVTFNADGTGNVLNPMVQWQNGVTHLVYPPDQASTGILYPAPPFGDR